MESIMFKNILFILTCAGMLLSVDRCLWSNIQETETKDATDKKKLTFLKLWGEFYNESTSYMSNEGNLIAYSHVRNGIRFQLLKPLSIETYLIFRYGRDLHRDFWNNRLESGLGVRLKYAKKIFLAYYAETISGRYLKVPEDKPKPDEPKYQDFRTGLIFWYGWDKSKLSPHFLSIPLNNWGEVYSDISYYQSQKHNVITYMHFRTGIRILQIWKTSVDLFGITYIMNDTNKDYWNNKIEYGPGLWIRPILHLGLKIYIEWPSGFYYPIKGGEPNPNPKKYTDRRMGIIFWIGW